MRTESTSILYSDGNAFLGCASHYHNPLHQRLPQSPKTHWVFTRLSQHPLCYFQRCLPGYTWRENCKPLVLGKRKIIISCTRVEPLNRGLVHGSLPAGTELQTSLKIREGDTDCFDTNKSFPVLSLQGVHQAERIMPTSVACFSQQRTAYTSKM